MYTMNINDLQTLHKKNKKNNCLRQIPQLSPKSGSLCLTPISEASFLATAAGNTSFQRMST